MPKKALLTQLFHCQVSKPQGTITSTAAQMTRNSLNAPLTRMMIWSIVERDRPRLRASVPLGPRACDTSVDDNSSVKAIRMPVSATIEDASTMWVAV